MAIAKLAGTETEFVLMEHRKNAPYVKQAGAHLVIEFLTEFARQHRTLFIGGERERMNVEAYIECLERRLGRLEYEERRKEVIQELVFLAEHPQDFYEGVVPASGGRCYMECVGFYPEGCTPICSLPSEIILQERMLECAFSKVAHTLTLSSDKISLRLYKNASDGCGHSHGLHTSYLLTYDFWSSLFESRATTPRALEDLISFNVLEVVFKGGGIVGSELWYLPTHYQMSQRSDFVTHTVGGNTIVERPIVNMRYEPLAGLDLSRLHDINGEGNRAPVSRILKIGLKQIFLAMLEDDMAGLEWYLADPCDTLHLLSRDLTLSRPIPVVLRRNGEIIERMPLELLQDISRAMNSYARIMPLHQEHLTLLAVFERVIGLFRENSQELSSILDWKIKERVLRFMMGKKFNLNPDNPDHWQSPLVKQLDIKYHELTDERFWEMIVESSRIEGAEDHFAKNIPTSFSPPLTTSAFLRGFLVMHPHLSHYVEITDWHCLKVKFPGEASWFIEILDPRMFNQAHLTQLCQGLGMLDTPERARLFFERISASFANRYYTDSSRKPRLLLPESSAWGREYD